VINISYASVKLLSALTGTTSIPGTDFSHKYNSVSFAVSICEIELNVEINKKIRSKIFCFIYLPILIIN
jgi:hypothetical protein